MPTTKTVVFWAVIVGSAFLLWQVVRTGSSVPAEPEISYSRFLAQIANGQVSKVTVMGHQIRGYDTAGGTFRVVIPSDQSGVLDALQQHGVEIWVRDVSAVAWPYWILNCSPLLILSLLCLLMFRQRQRDDRPT
jgi:cell division protease FtsH